MDVESDFSAIHDDFFNGVLEAGALSECVGYFIEPSAEGALRRAGHDDWTANRAVAASVAGSLNAEGAFTNVDDFELGGRFRDETLFGGLRGVLRVAHRMSPFCATSGKVESASCSCSEISAIR